MEIDAGPLVRYVAARQGATDARRAGAPRPWSEDPIVATKQFCSVRRDDDRGSVGARVLIQGLPEHLRLRAALGFRLYNRPETLAELIRGGALEERGLSGHERVRAIFAEIAARGEPVLSAAYKIQVAGGLKNLDSIARMVHKGIRSAASGEFELRRHSGMYTCHGVRGAVGSGAFVCYQTMQDLRWLQEPGFRYGDQDRWALIGIGAIRGLSRLLGVYGPDQKWTPGPGVGEAQFRAAVGLLDVLTRIRKTSEMVELPGSAATYLPAILSACRGAGQHYMDMFEVEHNLCEFDKYERIRTGESKGSTYTPRGLEAEESGARDEAARESPGDGGGRRAPTRSRASRAPRAEPSYAPAPAPEPLPALDDDADEFVA